MRLIQKDAVLIFNAFENFSLPLLKLPLCLVLWAHNPTMFRTNDLELLAELQ